MTDDDLFALRRQYGRHLPVRHRGWAWCAHCQRVLEDGVVYCPDHPEAEVIVELLDEEQTDAS